MKYCRNGNEHNSFPVFNVPSVNNMMLKNINVSDYYNELKDITLAQTSLLLQLYQ